MAKFRLTYENTLKRFPLLRAPVAWMNQNGIQPLALVNASLTELEQAGRFLPQS